MSVSIIIPFYNAEKFVNETVGSIVSQTHQDLEVVCVNDGSSDNTINLLQNWAEKDSRIKIVDKENGGIETALKSGLSYLTKKYTFLIGHDDTLSPDAIEKAVKEIESDEDIDAVRMKLVIIDENKNVSSVMDDTRILTGIEAIKDTIIQWKIHTFCLWKTAIFKKINNITTGGLMNFDEVATRYLFTQCRKVSFCDGEYLYLQHSQSVTHKISPRLLDNFAVDFYIKKLLIDSKIYPEFKAAFERYMLERLKKMTTLYFDLKSKDHKLSEKDLNKVKMLYETIDFKFLKHKASLLDSFKYDLMHQFFPIYYYSKKRLYDRSTNNNI
ncbi:glycosyltransferase family 2 protein [Chryseobacterium sp. MMS23-Vi53]|uniref:glycosyltransferase family 2 protein n=1 Tax=Chryseobacterium sp. MMS23-Vi53 TaxID=3386644 RepID=UPI0039E96580